MLISEILSADCTRSAVPCSSKKRVLEIISELAAPRLGLDEQKLFDSLLAREKMGTTGIGGAIAIPHGRIPDGYPVTGVLLTLNNRFRLMLLITNRLTCCLPCWCRKVSVKSI